MVIEQGTDWFLPFREGEEIAFRQLFDRLYPRICYYAGSLLKEDLYSEDIASEAFRKAWKARTKFASPRHVENFLYNVTRNDCLNYLKSRKRKKTSFKEWSHLLDDTQEGDTLLDLERAQSRSIEIIFEALQTLPGGDVLRMIFFQNKSTKEIAEELKTTENNVYSIKARALKALRTKLPKDIWLFFVLFFGGR